MQVDPKTAAGSADHDGKTYYFCSAQRRQQFTSDPAKFVK